MKFFHISDLHIGLRLMNRDLREDQEYILNQVIEMALREKPDAMVIAGDIYDKAVPSAEAVEIFDRFIRNITEALPDMTVMVISGNHDSAPRVDYFRNVLARQRLHMIGIPPQKQEDTIEKVTLRDQYGNVNFYLLPFVKPSMVKVITDVDKNGGNLSYNETLHRLIERESMDFSERNVLVSHQFYLPPGKKAEEIERADSEIRTVGNIDQVWADVLERFDYAALGHIHKPMKVGSEYIRYCGSPLACCVSEAGQQKGILVVEMGETAEGYGETEWHGEIEKEAWRKLNGETGREQAGEVDGIEEKAAGRLEGNMAVETEGKSEKKPETQPETQLTVKPEVQAAQEAPDPKVQAAQEAPDQKAQAAQESQADSKADWLHVRVLPLTPLRQVRVIRGELEEVLTQACGDYVTVILTDQADLHVLDMQDRLREAFPYLLEIRREVLRRVNYSRGPVMEEETDPLELCCRFLKDTDETDRKILTDVIHTVWEVN